MTAVEGAEAPRSVVVMGASAGGVEALCRAVGGLPPNFPAAVLVVLHILEQAPSALPGVLGRCTELRVEQGVDGRPLQAATVYVAPPGEHLLVDGAYAALSRGPKENGYRPSIDALFRTAAESFGDRVVGVVLSGSLDDGTAGLIDIEAAGGLAVVQDPNDALFTGMPESALRFAHPDHVVAADKIGPLLRDLVENFEDAPGSTRRAHRVSQDEIEDEDASAAAQRGEPTELTCPACGGTLWHKGDGDHGQYRCRVGHAYSPESLLSAQRTTLEQALWTAIVALEEQADLSNRLIERYERHQLHALADRMRAERDDARARADTIRDAMQGMHGTPSDEHG